MKTAPATNPRTLTFGRLKVEPRASERFTLSNGIVVHAFPDPEVPVVRLGALIRAGSVWDPADRAGLAWMAVQVMREGGGGAWPGDALDEDLDRMGASIDLDADEDTLRATTWCLTRHLPAILDRLSAVLREPRLPGDKLELVRARGLEMIQRRWDQPAGTASLMFRRVMYGETSPWGRLSTPDSVKRIAKDDLAGLHRTALDPRGIILVAAGDITPEGLRKELERTLGSWTPGGAKPPVLPAAQPGPDGGVYLVPRDVGQMNFRIGHRAHRIPHPDHPALRLMDLILGANAFSSRLFRDIRTKRGLAYAIWSRVSPRATVEGTFHVGGETKYETAHEAISAIIGHLKTLREKPVTDEEVHLAKEQLDHSFAFEFTSAWDIAWRQAWYEYAGLPADWTFRERDGILNATKKDVLRAAQAHLHPDRLVIIAAGAAAKCADTLKRFGPVTDLPVPDAGS